MVRTHTYAAQRQYQPRGLGDANLNLDPGSWLKSGGDALSKLWMDVSGQTSQQQAQANTIELERLRTQVEVAKAQASGSTWSSLGPWLGVGLGLVATAVLFAGRKA